MNNPDLNIEWVDIESIHANPWNPNVQSEFIYAKTRISILEHGFVDPIKVRELKKGQYEVIDGEHRWKVANELMSEIVEKDGDYFIADLVDDSERFYPIKIELAQGKLPVINLGQVSAGVARELTIVLNNTRGESDALKLAEVIKEIDDLLGKEKRVEMLPYEMKEMDALLQQLDGNGVVEDDPPPVSEEEPVTKMGDLWTLGKHRLLCGDSTLKEDVERVMGGEKGRYGMHDPPYGIQIVGGANIVSANEYPAMYGDDIPFDPTLVLDFCADSILWGANYYADKLVPTKGWLVWDKKGREWEDNFSDCELAWTPFPITTRIYRYVWMGMVQEGERETRVHPTQKPTGLFGRIMNDLFTDCGIICDFFLGSGTTLIAAEQLGRICYGIEIAPKYCDVIIKRYIAHVGSDEHVIVERDGQELSWEEAQLARKPKIHVC